ncbi:cilia- and flagella-associated protein 36, partial [Silurus meridionalis]
QALFQPVLATNDFQMFRSLMVQKNVELQLQALRVIKERKGALPDCLTDGTDVMSELEQQEMQILQEVLKRSKEEYEEELARREHLGQKVASTSTTLREEPVRNGSEPQAKAHTHAQPIISPSKPVYLLKLLVRAHTYMKYLCFNGVNRVLFLFSIDYCSTETKTLPAVRAPVKGPALTLVSREKSANQAAESWLEEARKEAGISEPFQELTIAQQEQLQQRAEYLRQQRDKLQALKKGQKAKSAAAEETQLPPPAPTPPTPEISVEEKKKLQKRKHLAEKLKEEVIKK